MSPVDDPASSLIENYRTAVHAKDVDAFMAMYDPDLRTFDLWSVWSYDGTYALRTMVAGWFGSLGTERVEVTFDEVRTTGDGDLVVVHAFVGYRNVAEDGTSDRSMSNRLTWALQRKAGGWRIVHEHTSAPVDVDTMKAKLAR